MSNQKVKRRETLNQIITRKTITSLQKVGNGSVAMIQMMKEMELITSLRSKKYVHNVVYREDIQRTQIVQH